MQNKVHYVVQVGKIFVATGFNAPKIPEFNASPDKAYPFFSFEAAESCAKSLGGSIVEIATIYRIVTTVS